MKFCKKHTFEYTGLNGALTSTDYVTYEDVLTFHKEDFAKQWLEFIKNKPTFKLNESVCYYYPDYEFAARSTDSFLNAI